MNQKDLGLQQVKLFIGTNEQTAKLAPVKGLEPPIFLTDVYPAFFCKQNCTNGERWGILSVYINDLHTSNLAPSPNYIKKSNKNKSTDEILKNIGYYKSKWQKSLDTCGVCVYTLPIPPEAIRKIMIYSDKGRDTNPAINQLVSELPTPHEISPSEHKTLYRKSLSISRWFDGENISCEDIFNGKTNVKLISELEVDKKLVNKSGLDLYYLRTEEKNGPGRKKSSKT